MVIVSFKNKHNPFGINTHEVILPCGILITIYMSFTNRLHDTYVIEDSRKVHIHFFTFEEKSVFSILKEALQKKERGFSMESKTIQVLREIFLIEDGYLSFIKTGDLIDKSGIDFFIEYKGKLSNNKKIKVGIDIKSSYLDQQRLKEEKSLIPTLYVNESILNNKDKLILRIENIIKGFLLLETDKYTALKLIHQ